MGTNARTKTSSRQTYRRYRDPRLLDASQSDAEAPVSVSEDAPISPSEDLKSYGDMIQKIASYLGLSFSEPRAYLEDVVFDVIQKDVSPAIDLPMTSVLPQAVRSSWERPASAPTSTRRLDHMCKIQEATAKFLYAHPKPNSIVVSSSTKGRHHQSYPPDKDGKRIDIFGRRIYSTSIK